MLNSNKDVNVAPVAVVKRQGCSNELESDVFATRSDMVGYSTKMGCLSD
jgi:hypothetical protein